MKKKVCLHTKFKFLIYFPVFTLPYKKITKCFSEAVTLTLRLCVSAPLRLISARTLFACASFLLCFSSCNMAPMNHRPIVEIPNDYRLHLENSDESSTSANIKWWEQFDDVVLDRLIIEALANNNDLKIAIARVQEYFGLLGIVSSDLFPQIDGTVDKTRQQLSLETVPPLSPVYRRFNTYVAEINAFYELDIWGKIKNSSDAAYNDYLAQVEVRRTVVLTLVSSVANSYIQLRKLDKQIEISNNTLKTRIEAERIAKARFEGGLTSELEYKQAQSETESAIIAIKRLEILIPQQENLISVLIGSIPGPIPRGHTLDTMKMPPSIPVGIPSELLRQRPDILRAEDDVIASNFRIGVARAAFFPDIALTGYYGNRSADLHDLMTSKAVEWGTSINLFQPIFTGGRLISQLEVAKAINNEACYNYRQTILNALREVNDALIAHKKNLELVVEQKKQVEIFQRYRYLAELQYNNGHSDYLNVLDAERRLFEAQLLLADTEGDSFISLINLYKALGGGWVIDADNLNLGLSNEC
jgi:multidrug efflux system outer membrane protein